MENINFCQLRALNRDLNFCVLSTLLGKHLLVLGSEQRETLISVSAVPLWENILTALSSERQRETLISAYAVPRLGHIYQF